MFSTRVRYALQILYEAQSNGCCSFRELMDLMEDKLGFCKNESLKVVVRLTAYGLIHLDIDRDVLILSAELDRMSMYVLVMIVDRRIYYRLKTDYDAEVVTPYTLLNEIAIDKITNPTPPELLKDITVQHFIDAGRLIHKTGFQSPEDMNGNIWPDDGSLVLSSNSKFKDILSKIAQREELRKQREAELEAVLGRL